MTGRAPSVIPLPTTPDRATTATTVSTQAGPIRIALVDSDTGFIRVFSKRVESAGWQLRALSAPPTVAELVPMRLGVLVVDPATLGPGAWDFLGEVSETLPALGL